MLRSRDSKDSHISRHNIHCRNTAFLQRHSRRHDRGEYRMKKGVGTTIEAILEILIILFFLMILLALLSKTTEKNVKLNTASLEISKLSNTFYLLNRSLYTTWYVSTVQTLFTSSFEGMECTDKD